MPVLMEMCGILTVVVDAGTHSGDKIIGLNTHKGVRGECDWWTASMSASWL